MTQQIPTKNKPATVSGAVILNAYTTIAVAYCGSFSCLYYFLASNVFLSVLHTLALIGVLTNYVLLKRSKRYHRIEFIMTIGTVVVIGMFASGGWDDTGFLWPFAFLPFVFIMTEPGKSIYWIGALIIGCGIATGLQLAGIIRQPWSGIAIMNFFACLTVFLACNYFIKRKALNYKEVLDYTHRLLQSSIDPFFTIDEQGRIRDVNQACEKITGMTADELKGSDFSVHFNSPVLAEIFCRLALTDGKVVNYRLVITPENEEPVELLFNAALYRDEKGRFRNIFAVGRDITEGRKQEKRLHESNEELEWQVQSQIKELAQKKADLKQIAYFASHDLQEPLNTTAGFVRLLQQKYKDQSDPESEKYFNYIMQSTGQMKKLIRELLEYTRLGSEVMWQDVDCQVIVQEVLADLSDGLRQQQATITVGTLPVIKGHPAECKLLFFHLLGNAIKFKKPHTPAVVDLSAERNGDTWTFVIKDNGIGIEDMHLERIFHLFKRLHNRGQFEGSGIGLAHCRKIVEQHGGSIWVSSEYGEGSRFYWTWPAKLVDRC